MPAFPGQVRHTNQNFPVLDLTDGTSQFNQTGKSPVKGIGVFTDIPSRQSVSQNYRAQGYLAVVGSTPYVYTSSSIDDGNWEEDGNWAGLSATNGIPSGGLLNNVLAKTSDTDYLADWTASPIFSSTTLSNTAPSLKFGNSSGAETADGTVLGKIEFNGVGTSDTEVRGGQMLFKQVGDAGETHVPTSIEFYTSTDTSRNLAFSLNNEKVAIFAPNEVTPTAVEGGVYYNSQDNSLYLGVAQ